MVFEVGDDEGVFCAIEREREKAELPFRLFGLAAGQFTFCDILSDQQHALDSGRVIVLRRERHAERAPPAVAMDEGHDLYNRLLSALYTHHDPHQKLLG